MRNDYNKRKEYYKEYYKKNKEKIKDYSIKRYHEDPIASKNYHREYYHKNKEKMKQHMKKYAALNKEAIKKQQKKWNQDNNEKQKKYKVVYNKKYFKENPEIRKNYLKKLKEDEEWVIKMRLRTRLRMAKRSYLKNGKVEIQTNEYGINWEKIMEYLKPFPKNIEEYHIDHIIPLRLFNFKDKQEIRWAFAPENHQWLKKELNLKKGGKILLIN